MLRRRLLTSLVSVGFQRRDSWTDCLCSNTLLCRTLFSLSLLIPNTHIHTNTVCCLPPKPSSSSLLIHTSSTSLKPPLFPFPYSRLVSSIVCVSSFSPQFLSSSSSPLATLPSTIYSLVPLFSSSLNQSSQPLSISLLFGVLIFPFSPHPHCFSCTVDSPCFSPHLTQLHCLSSHSLPAHLSFCRCISSCSLKEVMRIDPASDPAASFLHQ